jgi:hypothetical protein
VILKAIFLLIDQSRFAPKFKIAIASVGKSDIFCRMCELALEVIWVSAIWNFFELMNKKRTEKKRN